MRRILFFSLCALLACSRKTAQLNRPMEQYDVIPVEDRLSVINIPVQINLRELEKSLNQQLEGVLYEDKDLKDGDKMMMRAEKREDIQLQIEGQTIRYRLPLKLWVKYDFGITALEANGDIALNFKTDFSINPDWEMETHTSIENYEWLRQPKLKMGALNLPVGFIADIVLKQSRAVIARSIDEQARQNFNLRQLVSDTWQQMFEPVLISPEYNTWLLVNPQSIAMTPIVTNQEMLRSTILIESRPRVSLGSKPVSMTPAPLPLFVLRNAENVQQDFFIQISTEVPYAEAERLAKSELQGETFREGKRSVRVEDIELFGQGTRLIVNTRLSGSYNGNVYLSGRPFYNERKNTVDVRDLNFTLETRNFLHKSAGWLLKGTLRKQIESNMNFLLDYNLAELKNQLQTQLNEYKVGQNIVLDGNLDELSIRDAFLAADGIKVQVALRGKLNVQVNGLN